jgi:hypothetical protein
MKEYNLTDWILYVSLIIFLCYYIIHLLAWIIYFFLEGFESKKNCLLNLIPFYPIIKKIVEKWNELD